MEHGSLSSLDFFSLPFALSLLRLPLSIVSSAPKSSNAVPSSSRGSSDSSSSGSSAPKSSNVTPSSSRGSSDSCTSGSSALPLKYRVPSTSRTDIPSSSKGSSFLIFADELKLRWRRSYPCLVCRGAALRGRS